MAQNIVIYQDEGVAQFAASCLRKLFQNHDVKLADAAEVIQGDVLKGADMFVMPGGPDLPYCRKLNGKGNENIRAFVENGGTYLGVCGGAYFGCKSIEYHKGRADEICGDRELAFGNVIGVGSLLDLAPAYEATLNSASIANITADGKTSQVLYHGGCTFRIEDQTNVEIIARYADLPENPPAIIKCSVGKGRAFLSGVHFEITPALLPAHPADDQAAKEKLNDMVRIFKNPYDSASFLKA